jgi:hypothetical protein
LGAGGGGAKSSGPSPSGERGAGRASISNSANSEPSDPLTYWLETARQTELMPPIASHIPRAFAAELETETSEECLRSVLGRFRARFNAACSTALLESTERLAQQVLLKELSY